MVEAGDRVRPEGSRVWDPGRVEVGLSLVLALVLVLATRLPVARTGPLDSDEVGFLQISREFRLPPHHTLFLAAARILGDALGDPYGGFVALDMLVSAGALAAAWWWLRAIVRPSTAVAATLVLALAPVFWSYGAMAGNYTMIVLVGSLLLGLAARGFRDPRPWHPYAAAAVLALGTGYRQDIGPCWLPVFAATLWPHRGPRALTCLGLFGLLNLAWLLPMLAEVGGWARYRALTAGFAHHAGYLNSYWNLGLVDAPVRYAVKGSMALVWTLGPGLLAAPRGLVRLNRGGRPGLAALLVLGALPALGLHLFVHFGVPGYAFHYVPGLLALVALGIGQGSVSTAGDGAPARLGVLAGTLAALFLFYPTDYAHPGFRGQFDLAFARQTRVGLRTPALNRAPTAWRTANSVDPAGGGPR